MDSVADMMRAASSDMYATHQKAITKLIVDHVNDKMWEVISKTSDNIGIEDVMDVVSGMDFDKFVHCRNLLGGEVKNVSVCNSKALPKLAIICEDVARAMPMPLVGYITFRCPGDNYTSIKIVNIEHSEIIQTAHTVMVLGERIIDFLGGYPEDTPIKYLSRLYRWNDTIRIDCAISNFYHHRLESYFTDEMYKHLEAREGLSKETFKSLSL